MTTRLCFSCNWDMITINYGFMVVSLFQRSVIEVLLSIYCITLYMYKYNVM